ncbi:MAG: hypothetical protein NDJ92_03100 [Thermoanaerobaculia bacterium]|nr:hypothetical protein [Thermoanaerobaculia bacterium]
MMTPAQLLLDFELRRVVQPLVPSRAWRLTSGAFNPRDREKGDLLAAIVGLARPMTVELAEDPGNDSLRLLEPLGGLAFRLRDGLSLPALQIVLGQGAWILHDGSPPLATAAERLGGLAPQAAALLDVVDRHGLGLLVVAFHDDAEWTIGLGER